MVLNPVQIPNFLKASSWYFLENDLNTKKGPTHGGAGPIGILPGTLDHLGGEKFTLLVLEGVPPRGIVEADEHAGLRNALEVLAGHGPQLDAGGFFG